jgi:hypothetical protein
VRKINKRQRKIEESSTYLCKEVDSEFLGREIYADNVATPYSFYLIRKLTLAKDYQNLAEGEAYFEAICTSWEHSDVFEELVIKKIYIYVETEAIYYTLLLGSFEPTRSELRIRLKKWLDTLSLAELESSLAEKTEQSVTTKEIQGLLKQMMEMSNELFRLRKMMNDLNQTLAQNQLNPAPVKSNPVISRSIRTIHLKRAQPLMVENKPTVVEEKEMAAAVATESVIEDLKDTQTAVKTVASGEQEADIHSNEMPQASAFSGARLIRKTNHVTVQDWHKATIYLKASKRVKAPVQPDLLTKTVLGQLEDEIYQHFMNKRMRLGTKKSQTQKKSIARAELLEKINQAEYVSYSWAQVLRRQNEDILLSGRLSCAGLVASLESFLQEIRDIAYSRSFFGKKVRCSADLLRRLDGYILLDQYLQKLRKVLGKK